MVGMFSKAADFGVDHPAATLACSAFAAGFSFMAYYHFSGPSIRSDEGTKTRNFFSLSKGLGGLKRKEVTNEWKDYDKTFTQSEGRGISDKDHTKDAVNTFYNLVTDIYEWGWGQSFHFSPSLKGKGVAPAEVAHETRVADILGLKPGLKALDVGCGVGGPLRTIAAHSGAHVTGVTINEYQVQRCAMMCEKLGIENVDIQQGNFLKLVPQFEEESFDAAYAIEATCHSPTLEEVYSEIYRLLKPGGKFVSYEWVSTDLYDPNREEHVSCIDAINYANALPEMRTWRQTTEAARKVGFKVIEERDLAISPAGEWWSRLKVGKLQYKLNHLVISVLAKMMVLPKSMVDVHHMLVSVANSLVEGGERGIFSPMYMVVMQKP